MRNLGVEPTPGTRESFETYIRSEMVKWAKVIKDAGIKLD